MFKEHEKFWAFALLVAAVVVLAVVSTFLGAALSGSEKVNEAAQAILTAKLRILELTAVGLIGIAGAAGQSLFRVNENAKDMNDILKTTIVQLANSKPVANENTPTDIAEAATQVADAAADKAEAIGGKA